jgi:hypothetical protein
MFKTDEATKNRCAMLMLVSFIVAIGALLSFHDLGGESLWLDEAVSWVQAKDSLIDMIKRTAQDSTPS